MTHTDEPCSDLTLIPPEQVIYNLSEGAWIRRDIALLPVNMALSVVAVYSVCLKSIGVTTCVCLLMLLTYAVLCGLIEERNLTLATLVFKSCLILIPIMILIAHVYSVTIACHIRHYQFTPTQCRSCVCYGLGSLFVFLSVGVNLLSKNGLGQRFAGMPEGGAMRTSNVLWTMAVVLFAAAGLPILKDELERLATSRGYREARRLCRTDAGWTIMEGVGPPRGPPPSDVSPVLGKLMVSSSTSTGNVAITTTSEGREPEVGPGRVQPTRWSKWCTDINDTANAWRQRYQDWIRSESFLTLSCCLREERRRVQSFTCAEDTTGPL